MCFGWDVSGQYPKPRAWRDGRIVCKRFLRCHLLASAPMTLFRLIFASKRGIRIGRELEGDFGQQSSRGFFLGSLVV
jgi:hypothetical protein